MGLSWREEISKCTVSDLRAAYSLFQLGSKDLLVFYPFVRVWYKHVCCVHTYMCSQVHVLYMYGHAHAETTAGSAHSSVTVLLIPLRQSLSLNLRPIPITLTGQQAPPVLLSLPSTPILRAHEAVSGFYVGTGDLNPGPHVSTEMLFFSPKICPQAFSWS